MKLQGIFPAVATPFNHQGEIWKAKVEHNISKWNALGLSGYVITGSTGESVLLSAAERIQLWEWAAQYAASDKILIAGTSSESARETVELANRAAGFGYKAALVITPHYFRSQFNTVAAQKLFYGTVADQTKIPILLYNLPQATGIDLAVEAIAELSHHPNIAGLKDSSGDIGRLLRTLNEVKRGFPVLTGSAAVLAPAFAAGASGSILAFANAAPYACISIWEAHRTREEAAALDWQRRIERPARIATVKHGIPGLKYAMDLMGYYGGPPRVPFTVPSPQAKQEIEEVFADLRG